MTVSTSVAETGQSIFMVTGTVIWGLYLASGVNYLVEVVVPVHTRNAAFSLFVGLRADNSPKDAEFFKIHAEALHPRTFLGWLAVGTSLLFAFSWMAAASAALLGTTIAVLNLLLFVAIICGVTTGFVLGCTSFALLACACIAATTSFAGATVYIGGASAVAFTRGLRRLIMGPQSADPEPKPFARLPSVPEEPNWEDTAVSANTYSSNSSAAPSQRSCGTQRGKYTNVEHSEPQAAPSSMANGPPMTTDLAEGTRKRQLCDSARSSGTGQNQTETSSSISTAVDSTAVIASVGMAPVIEKQRLSATDAALVIDPAISKASSFDRAPHIADVATDESDPSFAHS